MAVLGRKKEPCDNLRIAKLMESKISREMEKGFSMIYDCFDKTIRAPLKAFRMSRKEENDHVHHVIAKFYVWWLQNKECFKPEEMGGLLRKISKNLALNTFSRTKMVDRLEDIDLPEDSLNYADQVQQVRQRLLGIPKDCGTIIFEHLVKGKHWQEIAELLQISDPQKVRSRYYHCINILRSKN